MTALPKNRAELKIIMLILLVSAFCTKVTWAARTDGDVPGTTPPSVINPADLSSLESSGKPASDGASLASPGTKPAGTPTEQANDSECPKPYAQLYRTANTRGKQILSGEVDATHKSFKPPKIAGAYCTQILLDALDLFSALLNGSFLSIVAKAAAAIVLSIITRLAKAVCNYVVSMVNSVLALACIPIPPFDLPKFGLKGKKGYCDGLQLVGPIATPPVNLAPAFSAMTGMQVPSYYGTPSLRSLLGGTRKRTGFDLLDGFQGK